MNYYIVTRSQHARRGRSGHTGPDSYIAVVGVPEGVEFDPARTPLNRDHLARKGITVEKVGKYYHFSTGPRSRYASAMRVAQDRVAARR